MKTFQPLLEGKHVNPKFWVELVHLVSTTSEGPRREDTPLGPFSRAVAYTPAPAEGLAEVLGLPKSFSGACAQTGRMGSKAEAQARGLSLAGILCVLCAAVW